MPATPATPVRHELTAIPFAQLARRLGSRTRALAARRWLCAARPLPAALPDAIDGVGHRSWQALLNDTSLPAHRVEARHLSTDGTLRMIIDFTGASCETVLIPAARRSTVCLSSQAGCSRSCAFCATATLGFTRHLTAGEIVLEYLLAAAAAAESAPARNIVFMGMGEPMDNLDNVLGAIAWLTEESSPRLAARHITVSTSGVLPGMVRFLAESRANLALSLNASTDAGRERLIPHGRIWPIAQLLDALRDDRERNPDRDCFIEYVLFSDVNDSVEDAKRLAALLVGAAERVNLIPHNPWPGNALRPPDPAVVARFSSVLRTAGLRPLIRTPRGQDVAAACGQLALSSAMRP